MSNNKRLVRSSSDHWIAGVLGGIAEYFGWDSAILRLVYVLLSVCCAGFPGLLAYIILWLVMPKY